MEATTELKDDSEINTEELWGTGRMRGRKPRVLIYTSLFPNSAQPELGNFIFERMRHLSPFIDMSVVAPVPYFPRVNVNRHWSKLAAIPQSEQIAQFKVDHPRYVVVPKFGMVTHGASMFAGSLPEVRKQLKAMDYDFIDAHYVYPDGLAATMLGALFNKPVVVSARGSDVNLFSQFRTIRPMLQYVLKRASRVVAVTQALKDKMVAIGCPSEKIAVIGNGVDPVKFDPQPKAEARQKLGLSVDRTILLSVGNLTENKGFDILIDAVERLRVRRPDVMLVIVGDGMRRISLENQVRALKLEDNVRMAGRIPHADLSTWFSAADVFCLASMREGCPNVVLEAMACGCPVVATRAGGIPDLVSSLSFGNLVDRTPAAFEAGVELALCCDWDHDGIIRHARSHSWKKVTAQLLSLYSEVLTA